MKLNQSNGTFLLWNESVSNPDFDNEETASAASTVVVVNCVLNLPLMPITIFGNLIVLTSVMKTPSLRSPSTIFLCGLGVLDLVVGLVVQPMYIVRELIENDFLNKLSRTVGFAFCGISLATMAVISVDRFLALRYHMTYHMLVTSTRVRLTLVIIWLIHLLPLSTIVGFWDVPALFDAGRILICVYTVASTISYIGIYRIVRRHQLQILAQKQAAELPHAETAKNLAYVSLSKTAVNTFVFYICTIFCYLPWFIYRMVYSDLFFANLNTAWVFVATLLFANSALNPFLYCWRLRELRAAVKKTLKKISCRNSS